MAYKETAKELGIKYRIGKYGFHLSKGLDNRRRFRIVPLDGWITAPKVVERIMRERGMEL